MDKQTETLEIDILQILRALWHRAWALVLAAIIGALGLFAYSSYMITPLYKSEALLYVNNSDFSVGSTSFSISASELSAAQSLVDTYIVILQTRNTLNEVIEKAELNYSYEQLKSMITSAPINGTEIFKINVTSTSPQEAELIANTIAEVIPDKIADIVDGSSVRIVDWAVTPAGKSSPSISKYTAIGMLLGVLVASAVIVIHEITDSQIHSEEYLIENYDLPILAVIPDLSSSSGKGYYNAYQVDEKGDK